MNKRAPEAYENDPKHTMIDIIQTIAVYKTRIEPRDMFLFHYERREHEKKRRKRLFQRETSCTLLYYLAALYIMFLCVCEFCQYPKNTLRWDVKTRNNI